MGYTKQVRRMAEELSSATNGLVQPGALKALRDYALRYGRIQVDACNIDPSTKPIGWEEQQEQAEERLMGQIRRVVRCQFPPGFGVVFGGDPRGYTVKVQRPDGRGNTMGGPEVGWGIEGS